MAIALQPRFPVPDRSQQRVRAKKNMDGFIDIGWCEGVLSDGRPFRVEMWAQDQVSCLTIFFSTLGLEAIDQQGIRALVEREGLVSFRDDATTFCSAAKWVDHSGHELWSVNIVVGAERDIYVRDTVPIYRYSNAEEPHTLFDQR